jgi:hypothetical protein
MGSAGVVKAPKTIFRFCRWDSRIRIGASGPPPLNKSLRDSFRMQQSRVIPTCTRPDRHQKTPAAGARARPPVGAYATLGSNRRHQISFCRIQRRGREVGKDRVPKRRPACALVHPIRQGHAAHLKAHGRGLADAAWRGPVESGWVSWNVGRGAARYLRPPSPRILARGGSCHHDETKQEHPIWG